MKSPKDKPPKLPSWALTFCCIVPFCSLAGLSIASACGTAVGSAGIYGVCYVCGRIAGRMLK